MYSSLFARFSRHRQLTDLSVGQVQWGDFVSQGDLQATCYGLNISCFVPAQSLLLQAYRYAVSGWGVAAFRSCYLFTLLLGETSSAPGAFMLGCVCWMLACAQLALCRGRAGLLLLSNASLCTGIALAGPASFILAPSQTKVLHKRTWWEGYLGCCSY